MRGVSTGQVAEKRKVDTATSRNAEGTSGRSDGFSRKYSGFRRVGKVFGKENDDGADSSGHEEHRALDVGGL